MKHLTEEQVNQLASAGNIKVRAGEAAGKNIDRLFNLTPYIFYTSVLDTINTTINPFDIFIKNDVSYGNGVRYTSAGLIKSVPYVGGTTGFTPESNPAQTPTSYEDFSSSNFKEQYPLVYSDAELTEYFKDNTNLTTFINLVRGSLSTSLSNDRLEWFLYIFGNTNTNLSASVKAELDKTKAKIVNTKALGTFTKMTDIYKEILKVGADMGTEGKAATNKYNIGFTNGETVGTKFNKSIMKQDLVLVISQNDMIDMSSEAANIYHQEFYKLSEKFYKVIECDIPSGTCYIIDKETLRIQNKLDKSISNVWVNLDTTIYHHIWFFTGIFKYGNGIKLTYTLNKSRTIDTLNLKTKNKVKEEPVQEEPVQELEKGNNNGDE